MKKEEVVNKSRKINQQIISFKPFQEAQSILFYSALGKEVNLKEAMSLSLKNQQKVILPITMPEFFQFKIAGINNLDFDLKKGYAGILEPKENCSLFKAKDVDLLFIPGVAFDLKGNRLGRGKGCYDRFLKEVQERKRVKRLKETERPKELKGLKVGIAYEWQIVDSLPAESHDMLVDYIITEERIINCRKEK